MIGDYIPNNNTVTHHKPRDYDRINERGFPSLRYKDPIIAANGAARRAANKEYRLIKREQHLEIMQDVWDAIAAIDAKRSN